MKGILLINMGGPLSISEMKLFLKNMFSDKLIIPLPFGLRQFVATMIANKRYPSSWQKYQSIGGTPIIDHTNKTAQALEKATGLPVRIGYSYTHPYIGETMAQMKTEGIDNLLVITMYPQDSTTTTCSAIGDVYKASKKIGGITTRYLGEYANNPNFLEYWSIIIQQHLSKHDVRQPHLLFTAHSIPLYAVKKGDTYPETIKTMAENLAKILDMPYSVAFQSRVGPVKWVGPDTDEHLEELITKGEQNIIIIPISFSTECLETVYDLQINLTDNYINDKRVNHLSRVVIPPAHPMFIETLKQMVDEQIG